MKSRMFAKRIVLPGKIRAPQCDGDDFRAAGDERVAHDFVRGEFSRADEQSRSEFAIGDAQLGRFVRHGSNFNDFVTTAN